MALESRVRSAKKITEQQQRLHDREKEMMTKEREFAEITTALKTRESIGTKILTNENILEGIKLIMRPERKGVITLIPFQIIRPYSCWCRCHSQKHSDQLFGMGGLSQSLACFWPTTY